MYRLTIARLAGFKLECNDVGSWLMNFGSNFQQFPELAYAGGVNHTLVTNARISHCRNKAIQVAKGNGSTHLMFVDPDMAIDRYVKPGGKAKPFFETAWRFIKENPGSVVAAPYVGPMPHQPLHVFAFNEQRQLCRVPKPDIVNLPEWTQVDAVGTGCMLIDMKVFDKIAHPYFADVYHDATETALKHTQDIVFCLKCRAAGVPIYVNWRTPCGHWQNCVMEMPGWEPPNHKTEEPPQSVGANPTVPVLSVRGRGDTTWSNKS